MIPWHPRGHSSTRLSSRSAVVLTWQVLIMEADIVGFGGDAPPRKMLEIETRLIELENE